MVIGNKREPSIVPLTAMALLLMAMAYQLWVMNLASKGVIFTNVPMAKKLALVCAFSAKILFVALATAGTIGAISVATFSMLKKLLKLPS